MPTTAILAYLERLPARQAEAEMMAIEAAVAPHAKERDRVRIIRRLERQARPQGETRTPMTKEDFKANLALIGIGFKTVHLTPDPSPKRRG